MALREVNFWELAGILGNIDCAFPNSWPVKFVIENDGNKTSYEKGMFHIEDVEGNGEIYLGEYLSKGEDVIYVDCDTEYISMDHDILPMLFQRCGIKEDSKIFVDDEESENMGCVEDYDFLEEFDLLANPTKQVLDTIREWAEDKTDPKVYANRKIKEIESNINDIKYSCFEDEQENIKVFEKMVKAIKKFA